MEIRLLKPAQNEMDRAFEYYEKQMPGLGQEFADDVLSTIERIRLHANAWSPFSIRTRRCLTVKFPYGIIYQIKKSGILIVAIAHMHRKPGYWNDRIE